MSNPVTQKLEHCYARKKNLLYDYVDKTFFASPGGVTTLDTQFGRSLDGSGTNHYTLDTSGTGPYYDAITDRFWITVSEAPTTPTGPQGLWSEGATTNGIEIYYRTTPDTYHISVYVGGVATVNDVTILDNGAGARCISAVAVRGNTDFACYVNGVQAHTATLSGQIASHSVNPKLLEAVVSANEWEHTFTMHAVGAGVLTNEQLAELSLDPFSLFKPHAAQLYLLPKAAAVGGGSEGAAMYHHLRNMGAY